MGLNCTTLDEDKYSLIVQSKQPSMERSSNMDVSVLTILSFSQTIINYKPRRAKDYEQKIIVIQAVIRGFMAR